MKLDRHQKKEIELNQLYACESERISELRAQTNELIGQDCQELDALALSSQANVDREAELLRRLCELYQVAPEYRQQQERSIHEQSEFIIQTTERAKAHQQMCRENVFNEAKQKVHNEKDEQERAIHQQCKERKAKSKLKRALGF